jgi:16S rRNA (uracil1498-N3)-methyltransferase
MKREVRESARAPRVFVPREQWREGKVKAAGEDARYLTRVLRLGPGDAVTVLDGQGRVFRAAISAVNEKEVHLALEDEIVYDAEPITKVALFQAVPKGDKMDFVIQKATELGVARIVPVITERVIVRFNTVQAAKRRERWRRIAREASRQCGRTMVPVVEPVITFQAALQNDYFSGFPGILPWEGEQETRLRDFLETMSGEILPKEIAVFIGPEGGFSLPEVEAARASGIATVSLGRRILRTETAGIITIALILYSLGELG